MDKFKFTPEQGFRDGTSFPNPTSETDTREQMQRPLDQIKNFINNLIDQIEATFKTKVDKVEGKALSTNDFTDDYKDKIDNMIVDSSGYYTKNESDTKYQPKGDYLTEHQSLADYYNKSQTKSLVDKVQKEVDEINDVLPAYWQTEVNEKVVEINELIENAGANKSSFYFYSDAHWGYGTTYLSKLLKNLYAKTAVNKTNFGGDIGNTYEVEESNWMDNLREWRKSIRDVPNHYSVIGNHDNSNDGITELANEQQQYGFLFAPEETNDVTWGGYHYYYVDCKSEKTRYLYLDTGKFAVSDEEAAFIVEALTSTPNNWHIVVVSHIWFIYNSTDDPTVGSVPTYCEKLLALFDAYNSRNSGSISMDTSSTDYDFTNCGAQVEFCVGGHTHVDYNFTSTNGIPVILVNTYSWHLRGSGEVCTKGTINEASLNCIIADYDNHKIHVIRIGRGSSREIEITNYVVSYTNILDEVGFKENTRLSASGGYTESARDGVDLTGYIPIKYLDVLRFKNMSIPDTDSSGYDNHLYLFDSNKTGTGHDKVTSFIGTGNWAGVWDNGNLIELTYGGADGFIRINGTNIDSTSIITKNEEID